MGIIYGVHDRLLVMIGNKDAYDIELDAAVAELGGGGCSEDCGSQHGRPRSWIRLREQQFVSACKMCAT
jgi:hypothetical protein